MVAVFANILALCRPTIHWLTQSLSMSTMNSQPGDLEASTEETNMNFELTVKPRENEDQLILDKINKKLQALEEAGHMGTTVCFQVFPFLWRDGATIKGAIVDEICHKECMQALDRWRARAQADD